MGVILKLDTKPALFEPNTIEIDGKAFKVKEITLAGLGKIQQLQPELAAGSATAIRQVLDLMVDGEISAVADNLQLAKLNKLIEVLTERALKPTDEEKNGSGPGDES